MAIPSLDGQPATQTIPVNGTPASQLLPSLALLGFPDTGGQPSSQTIPVVPGFGAVVPLAILDQGGQSASDQYGELPLDDDGYVLSRYTGMRATVDTGWSIGDSVGTARLYTSHGVAVGTVYGAPSAYRRAGFEAISDADYATTNLVGNAFTMVARLDISATLVSDAIIIGDGADRWLFYAGTGSLRCEIRQGVAIRASAIVPTGTIGTGTRYVVATADGDAGTVYLAVYDAAGSLLGSSTDTQAAAILDISGLYFIGRGKGTGFALVNADLDIGLGNETTALTPAQCAATVAALVAGATVEDFATSFHLPTDGACCGWYCPTHPNETLGTLTGAGDAPIVAQPASAGPTYVQPSDLPGIYGDWDCLATATYDGAGKWTGVADSSGNGHDMACPTAGMPKDTTVEVRSRTVYLPGAATLGDQIGQVAVTKNIGDFTLAFAIPIGGTVPTGRGYFSWKQATNWALRIEQTGTVGVLAVYDNSGAICGQIQCGLEAANGLDAHCILVVRRDASAGTVTLDAWYDRDQGSGLVKSTQVVAADSFSATLAVTGIALGGRYGSLTQFWSKAKHRAIQFDGALSDADTLALVKGMAARHGWDTDAVV